MNQGRMDESSKVACRGEHGADLVALPRGRLGVDGHDDRSADCGVIGQGAVAGQTKGVVGRHEITDRGVRGHRPTEDRNQRRRDIRQEGQGVERTGIHKALSGDAAAGQVRFDLYVVRIGGGHPVEAQCSEGEDRRVRPSDQGCQDAERMVQLQDSVAGLVVGGSPVTQRLVEFGERVVVLMDRVGRDGSVIRVALQECLPSSLHLDSDIIGQVRAVDSRGDRTDGGSVHAQVVGKHAQHRQCCAGHLDSPGVTS